jgi:arabinofuranosyltransferase
MNRAAARRSLLFVVVPVLLTLQIAAFYGQYFDDAFITYRYGANLASGRGLVFNPGEKIMGSTSPGESLLAALAYRIVGHSSLPEAMVVVGCIGWTAQSLGLFLLLEDALGSLGAGFVAASIAVGAALSCMWVSLETNTAVAFAIFAILMAARSRWKTSAVLVAAAGFMRPDAFILAPLLAWPCVRELRRGAWKPAVVLAACALPWFVFAYWYFGSPLPQSAFAKFHTASLPAYTFHVLSLPVGFPIPFGDPYLRAHGALVHHSVFMIVIAWLLAIGGGIVLVARQHHLWPVPAYGASHLLAYLYLRPFVAHTWHLYPGVLVFTVLCLVPLAALWRWTETRRAWRPVVLTIMAAAACGYTWRTYQTSNAYSAQRTFGARHRTYLAVSRYLKVHAKPGDTVAAVEVGTIGYYSGLRMFDLGGLTSRKPVGREGHFDWMVVDPLYLSIAPPDVELKEVYWSDGFRAYIFHTRG